MKVYGLTTDDDDVLNAWFEIEQSAIVLHSRRGIKGKNETNPDYSAALHLILRRLADRGISIKGAWVDSSQAHPLPLTEHAVLGSEDLEASPSELVERMSARMQKVGSASGAVSSRGNANKRIRFELNDDLTPSTIAVALKAIPVNGDFRSQHRLPANELNKVTAEKRLESDSAATERICRTRLR
jgi:hypothetical protein